MQRPERVGERLMSTKTWRFMALLSAGLFLILPLAKAAPRNIAAMDGLRATVSDAPNWCQGTVDVTVISPMPDAFSGDRITLQRLLGQIRLSLEDECPQATAIRLSGVVEGRGPVFNAMASSANGWALAVPSSVSPPSSAAPKTTASSSVLPRSSSAIQTCDQLAAHPDDSQAVAKGVPDNHLNAQQVIAACEEAVRLDKSSPRLEFQLARGYLKADRLQDAIEQLVSAAKKGHGGALAYLGDVHLDGGPGIEPNPKLAHSLYKRALAAGYQPAKTILAQFEDHTAKSAAAAQEEKASSRKSASTPNKTPVPKMAYIYPEIIENVLRGRLDDVPENELRAKMYLIAVAESIGYTCKKHFSEPDIKHLRTMALIKNTDMSAGGGVANIYNALDGLAGLVGQMRNGGVGAIAENASRNERDLANTMNDIMEKGTTDGMILMTKHPCGSPGLSEFSTNLTGYVEDKGAPRQNANQLLQSCQRTNNRARTREGSEQCLCISRKLISGSISMTRAERKGLATDFMGSAQKIINSNRSDFAQCFGQYG